jgi:hypothetical protein
VLKQTHPRLFYEKCAIFAVKIKKTMKKIVSKNVFLCVCACLLAGCGQISIPEQEITSEGVQHPGREWVQKEFFLSTFYAVPSDSANYAKAMAHLKEAGFNYVETAWLPSRVTEAILLECDRQGLSVMAQDLGVICGWHGGNKKGGIQPFHTDSVEKFLQRYGAHPSLKSVYICDEPHPEDFGVVRENIDAFERRRPDLLGFSVLLPSYYAPIGWSDYTLMRYDEYVDRYIAEVNPAVLSTDYYPFTADGTLEAFYKSHFWKDMGLYRNRVLQHDLIHWFYYQTVKIVPGDPVDILPEHLAVQAWAAVMYGVKGLSTYTALGSAVDKKGDKAFLFETSKKVNEEIKALGNTLLHLKSTAVYHADTQIPDSFANRVEESVFLAGLPEHISAGEFEDCQKNVYLLLLNKDFTASHECIIPLKETGRIYACDKNDNGKQTVLQQATDTLSLTLQAGEGTLIRIEKSSVKPKLIRYQINTCIL